MILENEIFCTVVAPEKKVVGEGRQADVDKKDKRKNLLFIKLRSQVLCLAVGIFVSFGSHKIPAFNG